MLCLSTLAGLSATMITVSSAAPTAQNSTASYSPKIYVTASGPGVGLYAGVGTRQDFRVNGPALAVFDNFNTAAVAENEFLVAITYPDGQTKGGISCTLSSHAYQDQDVTFVIQAVKGNEVPFGQVQGSGNTLSCAF